MENRAPKPMSRREKNKEAKAARIAEASRQIFSRHGYDRATMQDIARAADIATGTLFLYADSKRDLAHLALFDEVMAAIERGQKVPKDGSLTEQIRLFFHDLIVVYSQHLELTKVVVSEFLYYSGQHVRKQARSVTLLKAGIRELVDAAHARGELRREFSADKLTELIWFIYQGCLRKWIQAGAVDPAEMEASFTAAIQFAIWGAMVEPPDLDATGRF